MFRVSTPLHHGTRTQASVNHADNMIQEDSPMRVIFGLGLSAMAVIATPVLSEAQPESTYQLALDLHIVPG